MMTDSNPSTKKKTWKTILLLGATGQVGYEIKKALDQQYLSDPSTNTRLYAPHRLELDLSQPDQIRQKIDEIKPDLIINLSGFTRVDAAETHQKEAHHINAVLPGLIGELAQHLGAFVIHYSSTFIFDGQQRSAYRETDTPNPLNFYGETKLLGEKALFAACAHHLIIRANWCYGDRTNNFAKTILKLAQEKETLNIIEDQIGSPTWARDYANATIQLIEDPQKLRNNPGIYHLSAASSASRLAWATTLLDEARPLRPQTRWAQLRPTTTANYPLVAKRPLYTVTNNEKINKTFGITLPDWQMQVKTFVRSLNNTL
ncbi:MAG: dTDP-4-dehydrorhamnose reductase [Betaproteobacteria bacterium]